MKDEAVERIIRSLITGGFDMDEFKKSLEDVGRKYMDVYKDKPIHARAQSMGDTET